MNQRIQSYATKKRVISGTEYSDLRLGLYGLQLGDIVAGNVALLSGPLAPRQPPVALSVVQYLQMLALPEAQILVGPGVIVVEGDEYLCRRNLRLRYLRHGPYGIRRRSGNRTGLRGHRLYAGRIADPVRLLLLRVARTAKTVSHFFCLFFFSPRLQKIKKISQRRKKKKKKKISTNFCFVCVSVRPSSALHLAPLFAASRISPVGEHLLSIRKISFDDYCSPLICFRRFLLFSHIERRSVQLCFYFDTRRAPDDNADAAARTPPIGDVLSFFFLFFFVSFPLISPISRLRSTCLVQSACVRAFLFFVVHSGARNAPVPRIHPVDSYVIPIGRGSDTHDSPLSR